jgi:predicted phosphodiesterase
MKLAVVSDIHGNLDAFQAALQDIEGQNVDQTVSLGDMVGYGPEPEETLKLVQERGISSVSGNHELAVLKPHVRKWFNQLARESIQKTAAIISENSIGYLNTLPDFRIIPPFRFVHGAPPDSPFIYLFQLSESRLLEIFEQSDEWIIFVGHTHHLRLIAYDGQQIIYKRLGQGITRLSTEYKYIVNAGSVGQPRDGNNHAKYVIMDISAKTLEVRFVSYDIASVCRKIISAGFPRYHADRLR